MAGPRKAAGARELLVLRHAKSDWGESASDFDRPLAKRGRKDAPRVGRWLREEGLAPDLVLSSPAKRARETAERVVEALGSDAGEVRWEPRLYDADLGRILRVLAEKSVAGRRVLLVGHNPGLEDLVLHLGGDAVAIPGDGKVLPTAAVARFRMPPDWGRLPPGSGELLALVRPAEME